MYIKRFLGYLKSPVNIYITGYPVPILQGKKRYYYGVPFINLYERLMGRWLIRKRDDNFTMYTKHS